MATPEDIAFQQNFLYPLYLLLIGSGVLGIAVALLTHFLEGRREKKQNELEDQRKKREMRVQEFWKQRDIAVENRRKEMEIKVEIVSKMDEVIMQQLGKASLLISQNKSLHEEVYRIEFENVHSWYAFEAKSVESKLNTYFPETDLNHRWDTMPTL
jgi:hypothetical protein